jgi:tetratricopeptide (TPR) repeat protein
VRFSTSRCASALFVAAGTLLGCAVAIGDASGALPLLVVTSLSFVDLAPSLGELLRRAQAMAQTIGQIVHAGTLCAEERFDEAIAVLEAIDRPQVPPAFLVTLDNTLAWALAQAGQAERAITLSRSTIPRASDLQRPYCQGTLGTSLLLAGHPRDAVELLRAALVGGAHDPRAQAIRAFYLGEALWGLERLEEAVAAYEHAAAVAPRSRHAERARQALAALRAATPYRD